MGHHVDWQGFGEGNTRVMVPAPTEKSLEKKVAPPAPSTLSKIEFS